jgi:hypothetical protein
MDILLNAAVFGAWEIVVDDMHDVLDIETTGANGRRNQDRRFGGTERTATWLFLALIRLIAKAGSELTAHPRVRSGYDPSGWTCLEDPC